jgi:DNA topoisomerase-3
MAKLESYIRKNTEKVLGSNGQQKRFDVLPMGQDTGDMKKGSGKKRRDSSKHAFGKCIHCEDGEILENSKAFYCSNWKQNCKFTVWKNSLELYKQEVTGEMIKELLGKGRISNIKIILPQTQEKCEASLEFKENKSGALELKNVTRITG